MEAHYTRYPKSNITDTKQSFIVQITPKLKLMVFENVAHFLVYNFEDLFLAFFIQIEASNGC